jgi:hypothetical protein
MGARPLESLAALVLVLSLSAPQQSQGKFVQRGYHARIVIHGAHITV